MNILKQSTATDVLIGPFVDSSDGFTSETGVSPSPKLSKNGQALAAKNDVTTPVHDADGYYNCELDATDTNTVGTLVLTVAGSATHLPVRHEFQIVEEAIYDALFGASAGGFDSNGRVGVGSWLGTAVTLGNGAPDVNIASTDDIDLSATQKASVNAECDTALTDYDPPTKAELDIAVANVSVDELQVTAIADLFNTDSGTSYGSAVAGSIVKEIADNAGGSSLTVADIADGVWDEAQSGHTSAGTFGELATEIASILDDTGSSGVIVATNNDKSGYSISGTKTTLDDLNDVSAATVNAQCDQALTDYDAVVPADLPTNFGSLAITVGGAVTVGTNNDKSGYSISGTITTLDGLNNLSQANIRTAVGLASANLDTQLSAIETDTQDIQSRIPASLNNGVIPADIQRINDIQVTGDGSTTPFDVP